MGKAGLVGSEQLVGYL